MTATPATSMGEMDTEFRNEDIAIVGMACRLSGGVDSLEKFWSTILSKKDTSGPIPDLRWEPYWKRDSRNTEILKQTTSRGYFLDRLEDFDASFFGVSPLEAEMMDPQQRITLEVTWEALEHAGIAPHSLAGTDTAVFMGVNSDDYSKLILEDLPNLEAWMGIGTAFCGIPNRISYLLDLRGPSTAVDAACASSLVAVHHGRQALLAGETRLAIVGGVNAIAGPGLTRVLDKAGATTAEGCCRSFDASSSGYGRGEGASVLILKRFSDAIVDGDKILALLKGSAVGQDGKTNGIMSPNQEAQEDVARKALSIADIDPNTVAFVEAHATSTPVGDPCEVAAVSSVYGSRRPKGQKCRIGSVKPNFGHLEAGAGATSLIKAVLAVDKGIFPPQANFETPNPKMDWKHNGLEVIRETEPWIQERKRAGICSYGYGGTVSHAVIEQPPALALPAVTARDDTTPSLILLSAPQSSRIKEDASRLSNWISHADAVSLRITANTLGFRRNHHGVRAAFVATKEEATGMLKRLAAGLSLTTPWMTESKVTPGSKKGLVWVFSGHGATWNDMGKELLQSEPAFYGAINAIDEIVKEILDFSPLQALAAGEFGSTDKQQVLTYSMQIGLAAVLKSRGVHPSAIIGHSVGEIAASVAAGCLTAHEGALIVAHRANLYRRVAGQGAMILVDLSFKDALVEIREDGQEGEITAAIHSSTTSCVLSGPISGIEKFATRLEEKGYTPRRVKTDVAFHSPMLDELAEPLRDLLTGQLDPKQPIVALFSTSLSDPRGSSLRDASYWVDNMVNPVWLTSATRAALEDGYSIFMEISSHPIVSHSINETIMESSNNSGVDPIIFPTLLRNKPCVKNLLFALGKLHCVGVSLDLSKMFGGDWSRDVPGTVWKHKPYWRKVETGPINLPDTKVGHDVNTHTLLGSRSHIFGSDTTVWTTTLEDKTRPFPGRHPLHGTEIVPAAALLNTFLRTRSDETTGLKDVLLRVPVAVNAPRDIQVVRELGKVRISSRLIQQNKVEKDVLDTSWLTHTTAQVASLSCSSSIADLHSLRKQCNKAESPSFCTDYLASIGVPDMGFPWKVVEHFNSDGTGELESLSKVDTAPEHTDETIPWDKTSWAPALDAATSIGSSIFYKEPVLRMPAQIDQVAVAPGPIPKVIYIHTKALAGWSADVFVYDEAGREVARFKGMRFSAVEGTPGASGSVESLVHQIAWIPARLTENALLLKHVIFISEESERLSSYANELRRRKITSQAVSIEELKQVLGAETPQGSIVAYLPTSSDHAEGVMEASSTVCDTLLQATKALLAYKDAGNLPIKLWCITNTLFDSSNIESLSAGPLAGLARIIAAEHEEVWGGFIDVEADDERFPLQAVKYVCSDVISVRDSVAKVARLRSIPRSMATAMPGTDNSFLPRGSGTYLITGGLGALGLETAAWMVERGARRIVLVSRSGLPPRKKWDESLAAVKAIRLMEVAGATVHIIAADISKDNGAELLEDALERLNIPEVTGVVHAAGVLDNQLVTATNKEAFDKVLAPKIAGAIALHKLFSPGSLDFLVLFSSCGQLVGFTGQASYASGNAFLDTFADYRRAQGDKNVLSFLWTSWAGLGMASSTEFINAELEAKGITSVGRDEAFRAWEHAVKHSGTLTQAVVLRALPVENGILPAPILEEIAPRKVSETGNSAAEQASGKNGSEIGVPKLEGAELRKFLVETIQGCVARTLKLGSPSEAEPDVPLSEMGLDSVMTVTLRMHLQNALKVKVPSTLIWGTPTVNLFADWFEKNAPKG